MRLGPPLSVGRLLGRRKRFFADIALGDGTTIVAHCPNTGRLLGCLEPGAPAIVHARASPTRVLPWTWVLVRAGSAWVAVESASAVRLVEDAIAAGLLPALGGFPECHTEVPYGADARSRIDLLLSHHRRPKAPHLPSGPPSVWVEVKATTLVETRAGVRTAAFPDAVTQRGSKQLEDLMALVRAGQRAAVVFAVMRADADVFAPADAIDPRYAGMLRAAVREGVEAYALAATIDVRPTLTRALAATQAEHVTMVLTRQLPMVW